MAALWIEPDATRLTTPRGTHPARELRLGGVPRGAAVVVCPTGALDADAAPALNRLAGQGYESVAVGVPEDAGDHALLDAVDAALDRLALRGWTAEQVGVVGYGAGGRAAVVAASGVELGAAVSIAPTWSGDPAAALEELARHAHTLRAPWLGLFGDGDVPAGAVAALGEALDARSPVFARLVVYPAVSGAFHRGSARTAVHAAGFDSWQRTVEWLDQRVVPRPTPLARAWREAVPVVGTGRCPTAPHRAASP